MNHFPVVAMSSHFRFLYNLKLSHPSSCPEFFCFLVKFWHHIRVFVTKPLWVSTLEKFCNFWREHQNVLICWDNNTKNITNIYLTWLWIKYWKEWDLSGIWIDYSFLFLTQVLVIRLWSVHSLYYSHFIVTVLWASEAFFFSADIQNVKHRFWEENYEVLILKLPRINQHLLCSDIRVSNVRIDASDCGFA